MTSEARVTLTPRAARLAARGAGKSVRELREASEDVDVDAPRAFTADEVAKHASASDCWVIVRVTASDVTPLRAETSGREHDLRQSGRRVHGVVRFVSSGARAGGAGEVQDR